MDFLAKLIGVESESDISFKMFMISLESEKLLILTPHYNCCVSTAVECPINYASKYVDIPGHRKCDICVSGRIARIFLTPKLIL